LPELSNFFTEPICANTNKSVKLLLRWCF